MKQILFLTLFGYAACGVYTPPRRYPSSVNPTNQYVAPAVQNYGSSYQQVPILRLESTNSGDGTYGYAYETADGISAQEQGDARGDGTRAQGGFSYTSSNGQPIQLQYTADENGFLPQGSHLPVGLEGPIRKSIQQNLEEERLGIVDDGRYRAGQTQTYGQQQQQQQQQYVAPQYNTPTKYTPQRQNTAQQYRPSQYTPNKYGGSGFTGRPQTGYKF